MKLFALLGLLMLVQLIGTAAPPRQILPADELKPSELETKFLQLCDLAVQKLNLPERREAFYVDSYAARALAVAYDLTGKEEYLSAIKTWSDRMITFQEKMIPRGAYYMHYARAPFQTAGDWYPADCGSIAMGVLATAVRCINPMEKMRYLNSVKAYAKLVLDNYIGPNGGVRDGIWTESVATDDEWAVSSGIFGSLCFLLYNETGDQHYLDAGLNAVNWLSRLDLVNTTDKHMPKLTIIDSYIVKPMQEGVMNSCYMFYILEAYSAGLPYIISKKYPKLEELARKQIALFMKWNYENLNGKGQSGIIEKYGSSWDVAKVGGLPFHIYVQKEIINNDMLRIAADEELKRIFSELLARGDELKVEGLTVFTMMSMAEKITPGTVLRKSEPQHSPYKVTRTK